MTQIYVDGDACPVRAEVARIAARLGLEVLIVTNGARPIRPSDDPRIRLVLVGTGADAADDWIAERIGPADVCVTADIPLAARCLAAGARTLAPNGRTWTKDNIGNALAGRALAQHLRETGAVTGGPPPFAKADRSRFLVALDALLQAALRSRASPTQP